MGSQNCRQQQYALELADKVDLAKCSSRAHNLMEAPPLIIWTSVAKMLQGETMSLRRHPQTLWTWFRHTRLVLHCSFDCSTDLAGQPICGAWRLRPSLTRWRRAGGAAHASRLRPSLTRWRRAGCVVVAAHASRLRLDGAGRVIASLLRPPPDVYIHRLPAHT